jgi:ribosomal protein S18 acetylase RimI-like enzyme
MTDSRPYEGPQHLEALQRLAREVWRLDRTAVDVGGTVGELAWGMGGLVPDAEWAGRTWHRNGDIVGWATLTRAPVVISRPGETMERPDTLDWQVHPRHADVLDGVLDWGESEGAGDSLATSARPANVAAIALLERRGFVPDEEAAWTLLNSRPLGDVGEPVLPAGFRLETMAEIGDVAGRVAVHRAAWEGSRMTVERYELIMRTPPYAPELDCVVQAPDGELVASALAWFDPELALGELEPVGTHVAHRQRGLGRAVNLFALQRLRDAGATEAIVACRGDDDYPIPKRLYTSVGFTEMSRQIPYIKLRR